MKQEKTLQDYRDTIKREAKDIGLKPYSHNIISMSLRIIADKFGKDKANETIRICRLKRLGWSEEK
jgi:hypothetical protein